MNKEHQSSCQICGEPSEGIVFGPIEEKPRKATPACVRCGEWLANQERLSREEVREGDDP